jgi:hypothetical protein
VERAGWHDVAALAAIMPQALRNLRKLGLVR